MDRRAHECHWFSSHLPHPDGPANHDYQKLSPSPDIYGRWVVYSFEKCACRGFSSVVDIIPAPSPTHTGIQKSA